MPPRLIVRASSSDADCPSQNAAAYSGANRTGIPTQIGQRFRFNSDRVSEGIRTGFPREFGQGFRRQTGQVSRGVGTVSERDRKAVRNVPDWRS